MSDNLIPQSERTKEEQRVVAKMGGIASGKARREKKAMKDTLATLLSMTLREETVTDLEEIQSVAAVKGKNIRLILPEKKYCTDNGAMIGAEGYLQYKKGNFADLDLNAKAVVPLK